jgi:hypothetical protein
MAILTKKYIFCCLVSTPISTLLHILFAEVRSQVEEVGMELRKGGQIGGLKKLYGGGSDEASKPSFFLYKK